MNWDVSATYPAWMPHEEATQHLLEGNLYKTLASAEANTWYKFRYSIEDGVDVSDPYGRDILRMRLIYEIEPCTEYEVVVRTPEEEFLRPAPNFKERLKNTVKYLRGDLPYIDMREVE